MCWSWTELRQLIGSEEPVKQCHVIKTFSWLSSTFWIKAIVMHAICKAVWTWSWTRAEFWKMAIHTYMHTYICFCFFKCLTLLFSKSQCNKHSKLHLATKVLDVFILTDCIYCYLLTIFAGFWTVTNQCLLLNCLQFMLYYHIKTEKCIYIL